MNGIPKIVAPSYIPKNALAEAYYNSIDGLSEMVKLVYMIMRYTEFDVNAAFAELQERYEDTAGQLDTWITQINLQLGLEEGIPVPSWVQNPMDLGAQVLWSRTALEAIRVWRRVDAQGVVGTGAAADAMKQIHASVARVVLGIAGALPTSAQVTPALIGEVVEGVIDKFPWVKEDARPGVLTNYAEIRYLAESIESGEFETVPWFRNLLHKHLGTTEEAGLSFVERFWLGLQGALSSVVEAQAAFWFALGYRVLNAAWEDPDIDREVEE